VSEPACHWSLGEGVPANLAAVAASPPKQEASASLRPGDRVCDVYEVLGVLGRGASGVVYRAREPGTEREVAIKLLACDCDPVLQERLLREGQTVAALQHPGIGRVFSAGHWEGRPYLVYELLEGCRTLAEMFDSLSRPQLLEVVAQLAEALGHAHARGVVHRDVKPENVLLDREGAPRLIDFGHARDADRSRLTSDGAVIGTPLYMAPETFEDSSGSPQADVWSVGVILFRVFAGRFPFEARNLVELAAQICNAEPQLLRERCPDLPAPFDAIVLRALAAEPRDRYPDAGALAADLRRALGGDLLTRRSGRGGLAALVGVSLLLGAVGLRALVHDLRSPPRPAGTAGTLAPADVSPTPSLDPVCGRVDDHVRAGELLAALRAAEAHPDRGADGLDDRLQSLRELLRHAPRPTRLDDMPASWTSPVARLLLEQVDLDLTLLQELEPPRAWVRARGREDPSGGWFLELALQPDQRVERVVARLDLLEAWALEPRSAREVSGLRSRLQSLRGRLHQVDGVEARDRRRAGELLILGSVHVGAREAYPGGVALEEILEEALSFDPNCWPARYVLARLRFQAGEQAQLRGCVEAVRRCPIMIRHLLYDLRLWASLRGADALQALRGEFTGAELTDALARLLLSASHVELTGSVGEAAEAAWEEAERYLASDPGSLLARNLRAFLAVRTGRLDACRRDLAILQEAVVQAPTAEFVRALLLMREAAETEDVALALQAAAREDFRAFSAPERSELTADLYPECQPYRDQAVIQRYFRP
jgi:hypothetical protein